MLALSAVQAPGPVPFALPQRNLTIALAVSVALHLLLLSIHFKFPDALNKAKEQALDVILVNSKSARKPPKGHAQAKAQTNLDGGGNTDENRRASTPLPVSAQTREGNELIDAQRRVAELERQQQQMMTQAKSERSVSADPQRVEPNPAAPNLSGVDLANSARMIARLEGEIARNLDEYNKRPRLQTVSPRTIKIAGAQYLEDWRNKIKRVGELNYPTAAQGKLYGRVSVWLELWPDGSIYKLEINTPSEYKILNEAALRIVTMSAPFGRVPADMLEGKDIIGFSRTLIFQRGDTLSSD